MALKNVGASVRARLLRTAHEKRDSLGIPPARRSHNVSRGSGSGPPDEDRRFVPRRDRKVRSNSGRNVPPLGVGRDVFAVLTEDDVQRIEQGNVTTCPGPWWVSRASLMMRA